MILFLDFDGVLHPVGAGQPRFVRIGEFEACMRDQELKHVQIVISSSWRSVYSIEKIRGLFSHDIGLRIIGTTRTLNRYKTEHQRGEEIEDWVANNHLPQWVALDDNRAHFAAKLHGRVIFCNGERGFTSIEADKLRRFVSIGRFERE